MFSFAPCVCAFVLSYKRSSDFVSREFFRDFDEVSHFGKCTESFETRTYRERLLYLGGENFTLLEEINATHD